MDLLNFFDALNKMLGMPSTIIFLGVALLLTIKNKFIQLRAGGYFLRLITNRKKHEGRTAQTISPFQALFTAMASTIGIGNIVGPSIAIVAGGPGALFWIIAYAFFASVTKFTEVTFGVYTRKRDTDGTIIGGPMEYLKSVSPMLANWYTVVMMFLFAGWSGIQSNALACMLAEEHVPKWQTGLVVAAIAFWVLIGGAQRIGGLASKIVPIKFVIYIAFALGILLKDIPALGNAIMLVISHIFTPAAALGGFAGATVFQAMRSGIYRSIYITEAGTGTAAIPHSLANVKKPSDQGVLAMYSIFAEIFLCTLSGLIVLVTGVWEGSAFSNTLIYKAFKLHAPFYGQWLLIASISLFALTTTIGNSFNGSQSFSAFFGHRFVKLYYLFCILIIFWGSMVSVPLIWSIMDVLLTLVAIPNLIGIVILSYRNPKVLEI
jgi:alanine or glycine:cation symporter, AGCS family